MHQFGGGCFQEIVASVYACISMSNMYLYMVFDVRTVCIILRTDNYFKLCFSLAVTINIVVNFMLHA